MLIGGCGEEIEEAEQVYFSPGKDDKVFRLESKPAAVCRAEEQKAKPIRAGKPLRERFGEQETFCFGRDYDAAHQAKHPRQKVASIRVGRLTPGEERLDKSLAQKWPNDVKLSVSFTLKAAAGRRALNYICSPQEASWECSAETASTGRSTCDGNTMHLARGAGDDIVLINRQDGLPIEAACQAKPAEEPSDATSSGAGRARTTTPSASAACRSRPAANPAGDRPRLGASAGGSRSQVRPECRAA